MLTTFQDVINDFFQEVLPLGSLTVATAFYANVTVNCGLKAKIPDIEATTKRQKPIGNFRLKKGVVKEEPICYHDIFLLCQRTKKLLRTST